jgi:hypothetical protein
MPRLNEQELSCTICRKTKRIPVCCGNKMEKDTSLFFCPTCGREVGIPVCCEKKMVVQVKVLDIKKELFGAL